MVEQCEGQETRVLRGVVRGTVSGACWTELDLETSEGVQRVSGVPTARCPDLGKEVTLQVEVIRGGLSFVGFEL